MTHSLRQVQNVVTAHRQLEGGGFPVRRPFPTAGMPMVDPFLLLDEMGPVDWPPGEALGAPDHPHRGFETVTYVLAGTVKHEDSAGHVAVTGPGDVQWMTAGAGVVHSELPGEALLRDGGRMHGFQLWVNLPRRDKMIAPRYQDVPGAQLPSAQTEDGKAHVRVIAGEALGASAVIDTRIPIVYQHWKLHPGASVAQAVPAGSNAFAYVFAGEGRFGDPEREGREGQMVTFARDGEAVWLGCAEDAAGPCELLLIAGVPLDEPVARYGPFVMNEPEEIMQAVRDYQTGRMGRIGRD